MKEFEDAAIVLQRIPEIDPKLYPGDLIDLNDYSEEEQKNLLRSEIVIRQEVDEDD